MDLNIHLILVRVELEREMMSLRKFCYVVFCVFRKAVIRVVYNTAGELLPDLQMSGTACVCQVVASSHSIIKSKANIYKH